MVTSASENTSCGDLPPSSSVTGTTFCAAAVCTRRPTATEPVNETWSTPRWAVSAAPASSPSPGTTLSAPAGSPASWAMAALRPDAPKVKKWHLLFKLLGIVIVDIVKSNIAVARVILFGRRGGHRSEFVLMPVELEDRTALSLLAIIVTSTPGSAWLEYDSRDKTVLLHVFDVEDKDAWVDLAKNRYEKILLEVFQ